MAERALLREVGLRDGLQLVSTVLDTEKKLDWCRGAATAGMAEIEATSFVPAHVIPQFADADTVAAGTAAIRHAQVSALVVNLKGARRAFAAGLTKVNYVVSASEAHSLANARRSTDAALDEFDLIVAERAALGMSDRVALGCGVATSFGCTLQGEVPEARVLAIVARLAAAGAEEMMVADTVGEGERARDRSRLATVKRM